MRQLPLFDQRTMRERLKVPLDEKLVREGKKLYDQGRFKEAADVMREIRYKLEDRCNRINSR